MTTIAERVARAMRDVAWDKHDTQFGRSLTRDLVDAALTEIQRTHAIVPREPTMKMEDAGHELISAGYVDQVLTDSNAVWAAMR